MDYTTTLPQWRRAEWDGDELLTPKGDVALWSGREDPPAVGAVVANRHNVVKVLGYYVVQGWLMLWVVDTDGREGDLAGAEIRT